MMFFTKGHVIVHPSPRTGNLFQLSLFCWEQKIFIFWFGFAIVWCYSWIKKFLYFKLLVIFSSGSFTPHIWVSLSRCLDSPLRPADSSARFFNSQHRITSFGMLLFFLSFLDCLFIKGAEDKHFTGLMESGLWTIE